MVKAEVHLLFQEAPWGAAARGLAIAAALALTSALGPRLLATSDSNEARVLRDLRELEAATQYFAGLNDQCYAAPEILAVPGRYPAAMAQGRPSGRFLHERFLTAIRHRYRFEFQGSRPCQSSYAVVRPSFHDFVMAAIPEAGAPAELRSFAYYSYRAGGVYARLDRQLPTLDDTWIPFR